MLRQTGTGWEFENEAWLEDFLQRHLLTLLGLNVIAQQHAINGQICDLVAVSETGQITILELKNQEDRYITQQLTRYFDAFLEEKPFADIADYSQPIRLLAIAPSFHRDNFTDRKYSCLNIEFLEFQVKPGQILILELKHLDTGELWAMEIPEPPSTPIQEIPSPPKSLLSLLAKCPEIERSGILALRQQLLSFHTQLLEMTNGGSILYGSGKSKLCAELRYDSRRECVALFFWLPHRLTTGSRQTVVARMRVWTNWHTVSDLAHVPKAIGRTITVQEWLDDRFQPLKKVIPFHPELKQRYEEDPRWRMQHIGAYRGSTATAHHSSGIALTFEGYQKLIQRPKLSNRLSDITQLALDTWLSKR